VGVDAGTGALVRTGVFVTCMGAGVRNVGGATSDGTRGVTAVFTAGREKLVAFCAMGARDIVGCEIDGVVAAVVDPYTVRVGVGTWGS
jgi:hypothetical protein